MSASLLVLPLAFLASFANADDRSSSSNTQGLVIDTSSYTTTTSAAESSSALSYIHGSISSTSYSIVGNTLVVSYTTNSNYDIVAASASTVSKNNAANGPDFNQFAGIAGGLVAGILLI